MGPRMKDQYMTNKYWHWTNMTDVQICTDVCVKNIGSEHQCAIPISASLKQNKLKYTCKNKYRVYQNVKNYVSEVIYIYEWMELD